jgi:dTDP-4-amino-4,6-dideoxygalactose transaminase
MTTSFLDLPRQQDARHRWPNAWRAAREVLSLPWYPEMTDAELDGVVSAVRTAVGWREPTPLTRGC